eukprot:12155165-Ditylum_brightwellii.AAC.1
MEIGEGVKGIAEPQASPLKANHMKVQSIWLTNILLQDPKATEKWMEEPLASPLCTLLNMEMQRICDGHNLHPMFTI